MEAIKKFFPVRAKAKDVASLVIAIVIYVVVGAVVTAVVGLPAGIPVIGLLFKIVCTLIDLYCLAGIVIAVLDYLDVKI